MVKRASFWVILGLGLTLLSACDSAEERAQKHFENSQALLAEGDVDRALIELRNVFKLNENHRDARLAFARIEEDRGNVPGAYAQYLTLVEQSPQDLDGRRALARLASRLNNWEEAERHVTVAYELAPEDPTVLAVRYGLDYRNALEADDSETAVIAVQASGDLLRENPDLTAARRVVIDDLLRRQDWEPALAALDEGLAQDPEARGLYSLRLGVLERLGRNAEIEDQLKDMVERFPGEGLHLTLVNWYLTQDRLEDAEAYLRGRIDPEVADTEAQLELIGFLAQRVSQDAAMAEIDSLLAGAVSDPALFRAVRAGFDFERGNRDAAILEMQDILETAEPSEQTNRIKVDLARMLFRTGNAVGARAEVEEVLVNDPTQVDALKLKAGWLIEDDQTTDALVELRQALDQSPRDVEALTLMALAHERAGNRDLMGEMLALALEASGGGTDETLRYAQYLLQDDKLLPAESVLQDALRRQNDNPALLGALGNVYVRMQDWPRAEHVIQTFQRIGTDAALQTANELTARKLAGQNREEDLEGFLTGLADGDAGLQAAASIIRLRLSQGDAEGALAYTNELLAENPDNPALRFIQAGVLAANGQSAEADAIFRGMLEEFPQNERVWLALYNLNRSRGEDGAAQEVLTDALAAIPQSANLRWVEAGEAERRGDIDRAIEIYEELYAQNSNSVVVANNLASLIGTYREDDESLQRAYEIARRLRGSEVPAFQDTYGWIAHRLGNLEEAQEYLVPAAAGLPNDLVVQFHLAENHAALGKDAEALAAYRRVAELVDAGAPPPAFMDQVTANIDRLAAAETQTGTSGD